MYQVQRSFGKREVPTQNSRKAAGQVIKKESKGDNGVGKNEGSEALCFVCGKSNRSCAYCKYKNFVCTSCKTKGHLGVVCKKSSKDKNHCLEEVNDFIEMFNLSCSRVNPIYIDCKVDDLPFKMKVDTGAGVNCMPFDVYTKHFSSKPLSDTSSKLKMPVSYAYRDATNKELDRLLREGNSINYLEHIISAKGLEKDLDKVSDILKCPEPRNVTEPRAFCGMVNYYLRFVLNISKQLKPLYSLCKKDKPFNWSPNCDKAFELAKQEDSTVSFDESLKPYSLRQSELYLKDIIMWGYRVIVSFKLRESLLKELHAKRATIENDGACQELPNSVTHYVPVVLPAVPRTSVSEISNKSDSSDQGADPWVRKLKFAEKERDKYKQKAAEGLNIIRQVKRSHKMQKNASTKTPSKVKKKVKMFEAGQTVLVKDYRNQNSPIRAEATITEVLGNKNYLCQLGNGRVWIKSNQKKWNGLNLKTGLPIGTRGDYRQ
ncbi:hypothetical protein ILUMI_11778 [Ignelater luminosus]|uniref:Uncharacterized protein n=1 Tax=Ignelater luminosus TaxID=2038154 RepID=A0A8K0CZV9_IGNLU|nr:hypothetical protein ILUMI_11778 [Ignelater luminosus]